MAFVGHWVIYGGGSGETQRGEFDQLISGCWRIEMKLDCWSYPGFRDFKEKWTMPAFIGGIWAVIWSADQPPGAASSSFPAEESVERGNFGVQGLCWFGSPLANTGLGHGLGAHKSCTSQGCAFVKPKISWGAKLERQQQWEQRGTALLVSTLQFPVWRGRWPPGWGGRLERTILLKANNTHMSSHRDNM